jgi:hypothetical protein
MDLMPESGVGAWVSIRFTMPVNGIAAPIAAAPLAMAGAAVDEIVGGHNLNLSVAPSQLLAVVSFRLRRRVSPPIRQSDLANILDPASVQQIVEMYHEVSLLPHHLD